MPAAQSEPDLNHSHSCPSKQKEGFTEGALEVMKVIATSVRICQIASSAQAPTNRHPAAQQPNQQLRLLTASWQQGRASRKMHCTMTMPTVMATASTKILALA